MAQLIGFYTKLETLKTIVSTLEKKGEKGIEFTISVNDEANEYRQNVSAIVAQTEEQRKNKAPKFYIGNGRTFWANNNEFVPPKKQEEQTPAAEASGEDGKGGLPF